MKIEVLKLRLGKILVEEEGGGSVNWLSVQCQSAKLLGELQAPIPLIVGEFLRGADRRRLDNVFAHAQRTQLLEFLRQSAREPPVPPNPPNRINLE